MPGVFFWFILLFFRHRIYVTGFIKAAAGGTLKWSGKEEKIAVDHWKSCICNKKKEKNNFNMVPFKADLVGRVGYKRLSLWGSYTLTNMFKSDKGPELHAYTVGIGVTF